MKDFGVNLYHEFEYQITPKIRGFVQSNFLTFMRYGDKDSKDFFDNHINVENYRPQRFNFSLGFGVSYNFNFNQKL